MRRAVLQFSACRGTAEVGRADLRSALRVARAAVFQPDRGAARGKQRFGQPGSCSLATGRRRQAGRGARRSAGIFRAGAWAATARERLDSGKDTAVGGANARSPRTFAAASRCRPGEEKGISDGQDRATGDMAPPAGTRDAGAAGDPRIQSQVNRTEEGNDPVALAQGAMRRSHVPRRTLSRFFP